MSIKDIILCGISGILGIGVIIGTGLIFIGAAYLSKLEGQKP